MQNPSLTMLEAQNRLKVSGPTLYKLISQNKLKTYKIGRRRFTTIESIEKLISSLENEART